MSHDIVLFLLSHDFGSVFGREDDVGRVHGLLHIHNLDLDSGPRLAFAGALWLKQPGRR